MSYELIVGFPPFYDGSPLHVYRKIVKGKYEFPKTDRQGNKKEPCSRAARAFVAGLLQLKVKKRTGGSVGAAAQALRSTARAELLGFALSFKTATPVFQQVSIDGLRLSESLSKDGLRRLRDIIERRSPASPRHYRKTVSASPTSGSQVYRAALFHELDGDAEEGVGASFYPGRRQR